MFKNLATVHIGNVKTFVHLHKTQTELRELHPHDHSACLSIKKLEGSPDILQAQDHQPLEWKVDKCCSDPDKLVFDEEIHTLANLVVKGHNVATLFMEVEQEQKKSILDGLTTEVEPTNTKIEFAFFGFTDTYCYDLRRNVVCTSSSLIEKGLDHWMKSVNSIDEIWNLVSKGSKIPSVLKINILDISTNRFGSFFLFDLLEPKFIELLPSASTAADANVNGISNCFDNLRSLIKYVADAQNENDPPVVPVITDYYFLTHIVAKFICSQGQLAVFVHMNDIKRKKSLIQRLKTSCEQLSDLLSKKDEQQTEFVAQERRKWDKEAANIHSQAKHKRALLLNKHRNTFNRIKDITLSRISFLKKKMIQSEEENRQLKLKLEQLVKSQEKNKNMLSRELAILRSEREEFIEMFHDLEKTLREKNVDLNE
ncbi:hypothetical protein [Parasitella parasitica]|uniref:Uncharacterized protein n=1 Tax=Parasitella parasitica TaxID=35722 RepID=A0A0B7NWN0_9FUNG|nr:hypothetical protein [Parasitella parasitica]